MIGSLRGEVIASHDQQLLVEVAGVGYSVLVPMSIAKKASGSIFLFVETVVREDAITLYGFSTTEELRVFELLRSVSGVGPRLALGILSSLSVVQIAQAVHKSDDGLFRSVPGIGPKTAKLLCVTLANRLTGLGLNSKPGVARDGSKRDQVLLALVSLGWPERIAYDAIEAAIDAGSTETDELLKAALAVLANTKSTASRS